MPSQPDSSNWQSQMPAYTPTPNWQPPIPSHPNDAGLCDPVYMPINVGGNHWVMGAVNLSHSVFLSLTLWKVRVQDYSWKLNLSSDAP
ncbi:transposase, MuDR, MULE transposase domain protein [Tanacetum coccineum]